MSDPPRCPQCGARQTVAAAPLRLCPSCLFGAALASAAADDDALDDDDGPPFEIVTILARSDGRATYPARGFAPTEHVALKIVDVADARAMLSRIGEWKPQLTALRHPGLSRLIDAGLAGPNRAYCATEYVSGPSLDYVLQHGRLTGANRVEIVRQLADTLVAVHAHGLAHMRIDASRIKVATTGGVHATLLGLGTPLILSGAVPDPALDLKSLTELCFVLDVPVGREPHATIASLRDALRDAVG